VTRIVDRGAITAAYVGIGMAVTIGVSFLLVIPIEPIYWFLALPAGLLIGYYANQRSDRRKGPWSRIVLNAIFAGVVTGLTMAALLLAVKALFFFADDGYRDPGLGGTITTEKDDGRPAACQSGAECVFLRYIDDDRGGALAGQGVTDAATFTAFYWTQQFSTAGTLVALTAIGGLLGGVGYGATRPKRGAVRSPERARA
jgi:uncharacterized membrane-anchored protein YitT (DUF2179 family)